MLVRPRSIGEMAAQFDSGDGALVDFSGGGYLKLMHPNKAFCVKFVI